MTGREKFIVEKHDKIRPYAEQSNLCDAILGVMYDELHKPQELKVKRSESAKEFPLLHIKKHGDVGLDLPTCLPKYELEDLQKRMSYFGIESIEDIPEESKYEITHEVVTIRPQQRVLIPTGIFLEIPAGYWASIEARSSTSKLLIVIPKGVIDEGYRGELFVNCINVGDDNVQIKHGDRLAQLILHKRHVDNFVITEVDELASSERGDSGFGSTGQSALTEG